MVDLIREHSTMEEKATIIGMGSVSELNNLPVLSNGC